MNITSVVHKMAPSTRPHVISSRMTWFVVVSVLVIAIIILDNKVRLSLRVVVNRLVYIPEGFHSADIDENKQLCNRQSDKGQTLLKTRLKTPPSSSVWDGVHVDRLKVIQGRVISANKKQSSVMTLVGKAYHPLMNATYRRLMKDLILVFDDIAKQNNMTYFLYGGSLIGSYRHHGMIPWDDDVDIAVHIKQKSLLKEAFLGLPNAFKGVIASYRWKLIYRDLPLIRNDIPWSYPFLDISFFDLSSTKVYDADSRWAQRGFRYNVCDVFPLVDRPFWDMWLPAPRKTDVILRATYDLEECVSPSYSHSKEINLSNWSSVHCNSLKAFYPFVERQTINGSVCVEQLKLNNTVIHSIQVKH